MFLRLALLQPPCLTMLYSYLTLIMPSPLLALPP
jgi:hypothetical protein